MRPLVRSGVCALLVLAAGCGGDIRVNSGGRPLDDAASSGDGGGSGDDGAVRPPDLMPPALNGCGDTDPSCASAGLGPPQKPFPLQGDGNADPNESDTGVDRDENGWLGLGQTHAQFDFLWLANSEDWGSGTVSKINSKSVREVARYATVTCWSNGNAGGRGACDGTNGCCVRDDYTRYLNRANGKASGPYQRVQTGANNPSRTAVDFNGDVWVANRAFGGQSSVTKIANDIAACPERNGQPGIQTSSDVDGNGIIDTDCNRNGAPDDVADVKGKPCNNGMRQEYFGLDDECVLFTTNTNVNNSVGRPLALGSGSMDFGPADAWAGTFNDGKFFRVDGTMGQIKAATQVASSVYGATVDAAGILWAAAIGDGRLRYFDTGNPAATGTTRAANGFGLNAYGITMDRDQNVWQGGWTNQDAYRYTPDRSNGFNNLGAGWWTRVLSPGANNGAAGNARGIAADNRTNNTYYAWLARDGGWIARIDASAIPAPKGMDVTVDGRGAPAVRVFSTATIGVGVDVQQNIWGVSYDGSAATRIVVDNAGAMTAPDLGGNIGAGCPVGKGDFCVFNLNGVNTNAHPYTYSDFTGFGLRNFTLPQGEWTWVQKGCEVGDTRWVRVTWDSVVPPNTTLTVRARSGQTGVPDMSWGQWTGTFSNSPGEFAGVLNPNNPAKYVQVKFNFATMDKATSPKLKAFKIWYECLNVPG